MKKRTHLEILMIAVAILAMGAGLAAGLLSSRLPTTRPAPSLDRTPLVAELQLTPEQRDKMQEIWESTRGQVQRIFQDAQNLQRQRDDALVALLNPEQKAKFEAIAKSYADRSAQLESTRIQLFRDAVIRTKGLLTDEQQRKYDEILKTRVGTLGIVGDPRVDLSTCHNAALTLVPLRFRVSEPGSFR